VEVWTDSGTAVYLVEPAAWHEDRLPLFLNALQPARLTEVWEAGAINRLLDVVHSRPAVAADNGCQILHHVRKLRWCRNVMELRWCRKRK
jgi:hypothetical protein